MTAGDDPEVGTPRPPEDRGPREPSPRTGPAAGARSSPADELVRLRHELHRHPELSNGERETAERIARYLAAYEPDRCLPGLGGHGLAAIYEGREPGPCLVFRAELDALPIDEAPDTAHASARAGVSHKCGHDGHMAIVSSLARELHRARPRRGRVVLLYQPAEETGEGAARVIASPQFRALGPDRIFALHNLPGFPLGTIVVRAGAFAGGSIGLAARFRGISSHAAEPEKGRSPVRAVARVLEQLESVPPGSPVGTRVTVVHARIGERAFGVTPGFAEVLATLRSPEAGRLRELREICSEIVSGAAGDAELPFDLEWIEEFPVTENAEVAVERIESAAGALGLPLHRLPQPFAWSEDFGRFTSVYPGALFGLGAGESHPALHRPEYDFPDALVETGALLLREIVRSELGTSEGNAPDRKSPA